MKGVKCIYGFGKKFLKVRLIKKFFMFKSYILFNSLIDDLFI